MDRWGIMVVLGVLSLLAGLVALANPFAASLTVEQLTGWAFLILGAVQTYAAIRATGWGAKLWSLLLGVVAVIVGVNLLADPLSGLITLTLILGVMFVISGLFKLLIGLQVPRGRLKTAILGSGILSALIGILVLFNIAGAAGVGLGIVLAFELISNGIGAIAMGLMHRSGADRRRF